MSSLAVARIDQADTLTDIAENLTQARLLPARRVLTRPGSGEPMLLRAAAGRIAVSQEAVPWAVDRERPLTVLDLRRGAEIWHRCGWGAPGDLRVLRMPLHDPRFAALSWAEHNRRAFRRHYRKLALQVRPQVDAVLEGLDSGRDVLVTCQLGRDRTGIVVASVLARLGAEGARDDGDLTYQELAMQPWWLTPVLAERGETAEDFLVRNKAAQAAFHDLFDVDTPTAFRG